MLNRFRLDLFFPIFWLRDRPVRRPLIVFGPLDGEIEKVDHFRRTGGPPGFFPGHLLNSMGSTTESAAEDSNRPGGKGAESTVPKDRVATADDVGPNLLSIDPLEGLFNFDLQIMELTSYSQFPCHLHDPDSPWIAMDMLGLPQAHNIFPLMVLDQLLGNLCESPPIFLTHVHIFMDHDPMQMPRTMGLAKGHHSSRHRRIECRPSGGATPCG